VLVLEPSPALTHLAQRLQVDVDGIAFLARLEDPAVERLDALVAQAQARDAQAIDEGLQQTLRFVPRLLRGRAKKMLFPEDDQ